MDYIPLIKKKVSVYWVIAAPVIASGLTLVFGQGIWWESARLDLERVRASLEIREKMNRTLEEIVTIDPDNIPLRDAKIEYFNAAEKSLARLEGRSPVFYKIQGRWELTLDSVSPSKVDQPKKIENNDEPVVP